MLGGLIVRGRSLWRGLSRRTDVELEMEEEFRLHQELRAADLVRAGLAPAEAARRARDEFGSQARHKAAGRAARWLHRVDGLRISWLDVKLGFRMLVRYPGLTIVGGLAFAFAIWVGASTFELVSGALFPSLPLPGGDRIVGLREWDAEANRVESHALYDFVTWRDELHTVRDVGAFRTVQRNLILGQGRGEPVVLAEISASAFRVARVAPLLGRALVPADEQPGAPAVIVLGHDTWQRRFGGDSTVVGTRVRLGRTVHVVVGVMPEGFAFPVSHGGWVPLRVDATGLVPRQGPTINVFGRLAPGASLAEAQAELTALGQRAAADQPDTHEHLRPQVLGYARSFYDLGPTASLLVAGFNVPLLLLLVLVCGNVALLMFARAATRESELAVRTALGATRARIVTQLFAEALVLGAVAAVLGLAAAGGGIRWAMGIIETEFLNGNRLPFWFDDRLSGATMLYTALLTLVGAAIAGVLPALKVTRGMSARLKESSAGSGGPRFGGVWTAIIVAQVAVTVAFPTVAYFVHRDAKRIAAVRLPFPDAQYLSLLVDVDREAPDGAPVDTSAAASAARYAATVRELERRLAADPGVAGVTSANRLPRMYHPHRRVQLDAGPANPMDPRFPVGYRVSSASVEPDFFRTLGVPALAGRDFLLSDVAAGAAAGTSGDADAAVAPAFVGARGGVVVVNQSFVRRVLGGRNPIGRRIRYAYFEDRDPREIEDMDAEPWFEIVGVVPDLGMAVGADVGQGAGSDPKVAGIYHPIAPGTLGRAHLAVHVRGNPLAFVPRLREIATATDPTLRLYEVMPLDRLNDPEVSFLGFWFRLLLIVSVVALTLSLAGIYSVMSFAVARRTREIGIRIALGAPRRRVVAAVFRRPLIQVALGIATGAAITSLIVLASASMHVTPLGVGLVALYVAVMLAVCLLACIVPTRRALRVEPTEALRED